VLRGVTTVLYLFQMTEEEQLSTSGAWPDNTAADDENLETKRKDVCIYKVRVTIDGCEDVQFFRIKLSLAIVLLK